MTSASPPAVDRRALLAALGAAGASALAGCLGGSTDDRGAFEPDRAANGATGECVEEELVDEDVFLAGRALAVAHRSSTIEWRVDVRAGEEIEVSVFKRNPREDYRLPSIAILDPDGNAVVEERRPSSNHHTIAAETDGSYTVRVRSRTYTENHRYSVGITWYSATGCAGPAGRD